MVITREAPSHDPLARALRRQCIVWTVPLTQPVLRSGARGVVAAALKADRPFDWVVLTSRHAARLYAGVAGRLGLRVMPRVAAIGPTTAQTLRLAGISVAAVAADGQTRTLARLIHTIADGSSGLRVFWPRAAGARMELRSFLRQLGNIVVDRVVYASQRLRTAAVHRLRRALEAGEVAVVCLYAPSAVRALCALLSRRARAYLGNTVVAAFGSATTAELRRRGIGAGIVAPVVAS